MDAEQWAAEHVTIAKATGRYIEPSAGAVKLDDLIEAWMDKKRVAVKPSYMRTLEITWRVHVQPRWGNVRVGSVTREEVQQWVSDLTNGVKDKKNSTAEETAWLHKPKSASVVLRAHGILAGILDDAVADRRLPDNPARRVELPRKPKRKEERNYLTVEQLYRLADGAKWRHDIILTLGLCGMRWGELVPLRVRDVDLGRRRIAISTSAPVVDGRPLPGDTKTHENRIIMFPKMLDDIMRAHCEGREDDALLFEAPGKPGRMILENGWASSRNDGWLNVALRRASIPGRLTIHDLRHTAASLMVKSGANVKAVQRQLGHASAAMTLDVYADLFDDDLEELSERMGELLKTVPKMCPNE
ncbi:tyrosine-type recombinase/integrase [Bifidobacterium saguinibicoloris]|uniref:tyrosine-type recombinase/integrase n=1 Tax=Bifidobacterium saguinibicoloris TaxID=2834433 RepID=UPI001F477AE9|nr:site-specific integrase [Bifidobacterium saguinibicoloris]